MAKITDLFTPSKEVEIIFSRKNFLPEEIIFAAPKSPRLIIRGKIGEEEVVFKSCDNSRGLKARNIIKEGQASRILSQYCKTRRKNIPSFEIIDFGKTKNISWLVRKYYYGELLGVYSGSFRDKLYIDRFTHLNRKFANQREAIIKKIKNNLTLLRQVSKKQIKFSADFPRRFLTRFDCEQISRLSRSLALDLQVQTGFFEKNLKSFFAPENIKASVGDLALTNIFIDKNGNVKFFDLEWFSFDNYLTDITFLWLLLWRYPDWQKEIENAAIKTQKDELNFQLNVIRIILTLFDLIFADKNNRSNYFRQAEKLCREHPWRKYLTVAAESYDALIK